MDAEKAPANPGRARVFALVLTRFIPGFLILGAVVFLPAGDLSWTNGWIFIGALAALMVIALAWLIVRDPALLERRMRMRERERPQKRVVLVSSVLLAGIFILPGLDHRFGWSAMPSWLVALGTALMVSGYALFFSVLRANSWASRVIEVQEGQRVIDSGPYAIVRHPMYLAIVLIYVAVPLVLASWWALIPAAFFPLLLAARIRNEEEVLAKGLPGYEDYRRRLRWRMVPGIW